MQNERKPDPDKDLMDRLVAARDEGKPMGELFGMAAQILSEQPHGDEDPRRQELIGQLQMLQTQAPLLEAMAAAEDPDQGMAALFQVYANLEAMRPESDRQAEREEAVARIAAFQQEHQQRQAEHVRRRLAQGLSEQAGTGEPYPWVLLAEDSDAEFDEEDGEGIKLGASRIGGLPDLPPGVEWPIYDGKKIPFLSQLNLAELAAAQETILPARGWMYVFGLFDCEEEHWPDPVRIFFHEVPRKELVRAERPDEDEVWPDGGGETVYEWVPLIIKRGAQGSSGGDRRPRESAGWLFGEMDGSFGTPGELADGAMLDGDDWINLLAIESVGSMEWSDCGHLYLLARRSDLEKSDFSKVFGVVCSS